jgi:hypothetical protein
MTRSMALPKRQWIRLRETVSTLEKRLHARGWWGGTEDFPEFLGIGAQKAGTTWLFRNLRLHPDLFLPRKEMHYFDKNYFTPLSSYLREFRPGRGKIRGEITPAYAILPAWKVRVIQRLRPDLRVVLLLRNPIERAWSHAMMEFLHRQGRRFEDVSEQEIYAHFRNERSILRSDYLKTLDTWSVFPSEQVFIGWFEDIKVRPAGLLRDVFAHLGAETDIDLNGFPFAEKVFAGRSIPVPEQFRSALIEQYRDALRELENRFGDRVRAWLQETEGEPAMERKPKSHGDGPCSKG